MNFEHENGLDVPTDGLKKVLEDCCGPDRYRCIVQSRDSLIFGAVEAVLREPLSRPYSLLSGINTGIFHGIGIIRQSS